MSIMGTNCGAIFDRDGVINIDHGYIGTIEHFEFRDDVFDALDYFKARGYKLIIATNQSGIDRGYYTLGDFLKVTAFMQERLREVLGFGFDRIYFCPHLESRGCSCRKPRPGMLLRAICDFALDSKKSFFVGDKSSDMQAALDARLKGYFLNGSYEGCQRIESLRELKELYA